MNHEYFLGVIKKLTTNKEVIQFYEEKLKDLNLTQKKHEFIKCNEAINACLSIMEYVNESNDILTREGMTTYEGGMQIIFSYTLDTLIFHTLSENVADKKIMLGLYEVINKYAMRHCLNEDYKKLDLYEDLNKVLV